MIGTGTVVTRIQAMHRLKGTLLQLITLTKSDGIVFTTQDGRILVRGSKRVKEP